MKRMTFRSAVLAAALAVSCSTSIVAQEAAIEADVLADEASAPVVQAPDAQSSTVTATQDAELQPAEPIAEPLEPNAPTTVVSTSSENGESSIVITRAPTATPVGNAASVTSGSTLFSVMLALVAVVVMIFGTAWFIKRFTGLSPLNNRQIKIVASLPVGARERVVLVEVGEEQLLLGVTPQQISHLHTLKEPLVTPDKPGNSEFAQRLQAMLSKGKSE